MSQRSGPQYHLAVGRSRTGSADWRAPGQAGRAGGPRPPVGRAGPQRTARLGCRQSVLTQNSRGLCFLPAEPSACRARPVAVSVAVHQRLALSTEVHPAGDLHGLTPVDMAGSSAHNKRICVLYCALSWPVRPGRRGSWMALPIHRFTALRGPSARVARRAPVVITGRRWPGMDLCWPRTAPRRPARVSGRRGRARSQERHDLPAPVTGRRPSRPPVDALAVRQARRRRSDSPRGR